jgi:hypothetical protein
MMRFKATMTITTSRSMFVGYVGRAMCGTTGN